MTQPSGLIEIVDRNGWRRKFPIQKALIYVGSAPDNDVVLEGAHSSIAPRHLQLFPTLVGRGYRLVNVGTSDVWLGNKALPPRSVADVLNGELIRVGEFTLTVQPGGPDAQGVLAGGGSALAASEIASSVIGLRLNLAQIELGLARPLEGSVIVQNLGNQPSVQFKLEGDGLPADCFEIGPGPILFPNAEKEVFFKLHHPRRASPPAGTHRLHLRATAPAAYAGEQAVVAQTITILPYYNHKLNLILPQEEMTRRNRGRERP